MPTVGEIHQLLASSGLLAGDSINLTVNSEVIVDALAPDQAASPSAMSWLSPKAQDPGGRVRSFEGALLIAPSGNFEPRRLSTVAICANPKLAFSVAASTFFGSALQVAWPLGSASVHESSTLGDGVTLAVGAVIGPNVVLGRGTRVGPNTCIAHTETGEDVLIGANCTLGGAGFGFERDESGAWYRFPHVGRVVIEEKVEIGNNTCIDRGALGDTRLRRGAKIDNLVHIAHNVDIGENVLVIAHAMVAGSVRIGPRAWIAPSSAIRNQLTIGEGATVGLGAIVVRDVSAFEVVVGNPARPHVQP
jgi:UDP-3-O-[3-hydroxymyristoyl] glucosamine N-acyltransferase